jgi:hypothetical protein
MLEILQEIEEKVINGRWIESKCKGNGGVGITLESLLNKEVENFEIPDYKGIELKAKCSKKEAHITLFSAVPDSYLFEIKRLLKEYGVPDKEFPQFNVLNLSVYGNRRVKLGNYYFKIFVDWKNEKVVLRVYDSKFKIVDELTSWSFEMLKEKLERKLDKLAIVHADRKFEHNTVYFKYTKIDFYQLTSFEKFLTLIELGMIRITFRIAVYKDKRRFGNIYDHGTSFSIDECEIPRLFTLINLGDQGK